MASLSFSHFFFHNNFPDIKNPLFKEHRFYELRCKESLMLLSVHCLSVFVVVDVAVSVVILFFFVVCVWGGGVSGFINRTLQREYLPCE